MYFFVAFMCNSLKI